MSDKQIQEITRLVAEAWNQTMTPEKLAALAGRGSEISALVEAAARTLLYDWTERERTLRKLLAEAESQAAEAHLQSAMWESLEAYVRRLAAEEVERERSQADRLS